MEGKKTLNELESNLETVSFEKGKLRIKVIFENEPSESALERFNNIYNKNFEEFNK